ncbi:MAG: YccF domain-containing protein [Bacteroidales bacterium]|nr:YccF domain-containing protein [Bacteroidales bacterium]
MKTLGNVIWLVFGGFITALEYVIASFLLIITIIGIPFGLQTIKLASLAIWPFGREARQSDRAPGCFSTLMNIIWILIGGIWISLTHLIFALLLAITIIGIPFAMQHLKLAGLALTPFGRVIVSKNQ